MQGNSQSLLEDQQAIPRKRRRADSDSSSVLRKRQRQSEEPFNKRAGLQSATNEAPDPSTSHLPSPTLTGCDQKRENRSPGALTRTGQRRVAPLDSRSPRKRTRLLSEPVRTPAVDEWLARLPQTNEYDPLTNLNNTADDRMSRPPSKRGRSTDSVSDRSQSGNSSGTAVSKDKKYSEYKSTNYDAVLATKGSFKVASKSGKVEADNMLCDSLFTNVQAIPKDLLFDDNYFGAFHTNLRGRSEARICADLHPRIMPSVENLYVYGRADFAGLIEGHNDRWSKSIPFYGSRPQPDHTYGFKWDNFTEEQRRKLNIEPTQPSYYTAREDVYFPFLTGEVKCGKQGLDLADKPNLNSMSVVQRGVVDVYRRANRVAEVHRRVLGFSVSHDDDGVRIYAHYPEIDGEKTTFWRERLKAFTIEENRWRTYQFTLNVCELFALPFLERLKNVIDELPDPAMQSFGVIASLEDISVQSSQDDVTESQDEGFKTPMGRGMNAELRSMIQGLQQQLEQQRRDSDRKLEQQRQDAERKLEQQRQESEQQRKELEQQQKDLMDMLKQQSAQINQLLRRAS